jgi:hypothetical protein
MSMNHEHLALGGRRFSSAAGIATLLAVMLVAAVGASAQTAAPAGPAAKPASDSTKVTPSQEERSSYSMFDASGTGFLVGANELGELRIGGYALVRYINQLPAN